MVPTLDRNIMFTNHVDPFRTVNRSVGWINSLTNSSYGTYTTLMKYWGCWQYVVSEILHIKLCWWAWAVSSRLFHSLNCRQSSSEIQTGHPSAGSWWGQNVPCTVGDFCTTCMSIYIYREVSFLQRVQPFVMPGQPQWLGYAGLCLMLKQCL